MATAQRRFVPTFYTVLLVICFLVIGNIPWIIAGLWLPLVYAIVDILLLAVVLVIVWNGCRLQDVIRLLKNEIVVEQGRDYPEKIWSKPRGWTRVQYSLDAKHRSLPNVQLVSSGHSIRVGARANRSDLKRLLRILKRHIPTSQVVAE